MLHVTRHNHSLPENHTSSEKESTQWFCVNYKLSISFSGLHVTPLKMTGNTAEKGMKSILFLRNMFCPTKFLDREFWAFSSPISQSIRCAIHVCQKACAEPNMYNTDVDEAARK